VLAGNAAAYAAGVRPGQSLNAAIAFASQLEARPRNAAQEQERLARLAAWCQQFTPLVSLEPGNELLLEVKGSLALFEGARSLLQRLATGLREQGITAQLALAPTPRAALWLARALPSPQPSPAGGRGSEALAPSPLRGEGWGEGRIVEKPEALGRHLAPVPLRLLGWPEELFAQLTSLGLRTIGDLMRLPRSGMARRLGQARLDELDRALGRRADVRRGFRRPQRFDARRAPDHEIESAPGLAAACEPLLDELQAYLRERQAAIAVLALEIRHRSQPRTRLRIGLAAPSGDITHLRALLEERLASLSLPAPAIALRLHSGALLEQVPVAGNLKIEERAGARAPADALPRLLERLRARLGPEAVFGVSTVEDHRPECAWRTNDVPSPHPSSASGRGSGAPYDSADFRPLPPGERDGVRGAGRPLWLCAEPQWLSDKNPITRGRAPLELLSGPERIETGWWDGREVLRDYFVARDARGVRLWIYRDRCAPHGWYLHGLFG
jgi:protein ImuB